MTLRSICGPAAAVQQHLHTTGSRLVDVLQHSKEERLMELYILDGHERVLKNLYHIDEHNCIYVVIYMIVTIISPDLTDNVIRISKNIAYKENPTSFGPPRR